MHFKANYNFSVWSNHFVKGKEYTVTDKEVLEKLESLEPNPYGGAMFTEVGQDQASNKAKPGTGSGDEGEDGVRSEEENAELLKLQEEFEKKFDKAPPPTYKNNKAWLEKKLAE